MDEDHVGAELAQQAVAVDQVAQVLLDLTVVGGVHDDADVTVHAVGELAAADAEMALAVGALDRPLQLVVVPADPGPQHDEDRRQDILHLGVQVGARGGAEDLLDGPPEGELTGGVDGPVDPRRFLGCQVADVDAVCHLTREGVLRTGHVRLSAPRCPN